MRRLRCTLTGTTPLFRHADSVEWSDAMDEWKAAAKADGKTKSKAGDDRTPAHRWIGYLHNDGEHVVVPAMEITAMMREGGKSFTDETRSARATMKRAAVTGVTVESAYIPILVNAKPVPWAPIAALIDEPDIAKHRDVAASLGFALDTRRVKVQSSKHIRVRPRFDRWSLEVRLTVNHEGLESTERMVAFLTTCGMIAGLGDWRPNAPTPGPFGRFSAAVDVIR